MTSEERVHAVAKFGFTERQARFLVTVMRHSGVCMLRQYCAFAGIVHGQKTRKLSRSWCGSSSSRRTTAPTTGRASTTSSTLGLYRAIGEPASYLRRPPALPRAVERSDAARRRRRQPGARLAHNVCSPNPPISSKPRIVANCSVTASGVPPPGKAHSRR
jgi:hypothetical protein